MIERKNELLGENPVTVTLLLLEGQAGEDLELRNKAMLLRISERITQKSPFTLVFKDLKSKGLSQVTHLVGLSFKDRREPAMWHQIVFHLISCI
jgi:hypothetical protein